jgi:protein required for attachment to host cells
LTILFERLNCCASLGLSLRIINLKRNQKMDKNSHGKSQGKKQNHASTTSQTDSQSESQIHSFIDSVKEELSAVTEPIQPYVESALGSGKGVVSHLRRNKFAYLVGAATFATVVLLATQISPEPAQEERRH